MTTQDDLVQIINYYRNRASELELQVLELQLKIAKLDTITQEVIENETPD